MLVNRSILLLAFLFTIKCYAQTPVDLSGFRRSAGVTATVNHEELNISWMTGPTEKGMLTIDLNQARPLIKSIRIGHAGAVQTIAAGLDPVYVLTVGKRTLSPSSGGWDVFFDKVPERPYRSYRVVFRKTRAAVITQGSHTVIRIGEVHAADFKGDLEITIYNGTSLFNMAAVMSTPSDSTAILYDAGLVMPSAAFENIAWADVNATLHREKADMNRESEDLPVKYRTIIGENAGGSLAVFPAPHQYFYPLDEAFNLKFTWYGKNYHQLIPEFGLGIRQDPLGDKRYVPWFNAPPDTRQRLNFFCLISGHNAQQTLTEVKKFTHGDSYRPLPGYKTMESHFHNEFISKVVLAGKPVPQEPSFVKVFKQTGVNIVHLAEFHGPGHPKGPDSLRLPELDALFKQCRSLSDSQFLLLPGEEANNFYGGHWLALFPRPVYWVMSHPANIPFEQQSDRYGKVYHVGSSDEMLRLLTKERGLAWTAHARTKASTGYPDAYKNEPFFLSETFMGAAWKALPADLSIPMLGQRVLRLMDDMNNWGLRKHIISECDIFSIEPENEMYAHLNVNYLRMDKLPRFDAGWQPVLDVIRSGDFFSTTGEVLIPSFTVNGRRPGETVQPDGNGQAEIRCQLDWTFPLNFADIVTGDGRQTFRDHINLDTTTAFGSRTITRRIDLRGKKWVRLEAWDIAANGAFTQTIWIK
ncbi:MAG: hypothetical protein JST42_24325 [Bacteroidetes bacterium]|nr:hypothetical protein [Bacteroidota bacterium]